VAVAEHTADVVAAVRTADQAAADIVAAADTEAAAGTEQAAADTEQAAADTVAAGTEQAAEHTVAAEHTAAVAAALQFLPVPLPFHTPYDKRSP